MHWRLRRLSFPLPAANAQGLDASQQVLVWIAPRAAGRREGEETSDRGAGPVRATGDIMPSFGRPYINSPTSFWSLLPSSFTVLRQL